MVWNCNLRLVATCLVQKTTLQPDSHYPERGKVHDPKHSFSLSYGREYGSPKSKIWSLRDC